MTTANRQFVLGLAIIACSLTGICSPVKAVLCLGPNGHIAIEAEHGGCCQHISGKAPGLVLESTAARHRCCIDIPLPAQSRPYTLNLHKPVGDPGRVQEPCAQSVDSIAAASLAPAFDALAHPPGPPTATIVLLI